MRISHRTVAALPRGYSVVLVPGKADGQWPAFAAGSEGEAELLLFAPPGFRPRPALRGGARSGRDSHL